MCLVANLLSGAGDLDHQRKRDLLELATLMRHGFAVEVEAERDVGMTHVPRDFLGHEAVTGIAHAGDQFTEGIPAQIVDTGIVFGADELFVEVLAVGERLVALADEDELVAMGREMTGEVLP